MKGNKTYSEKNGEGSLLDHYAFSMDLRMGDFGAIDFNNDGEWDHIGFISNREDFAGYWGNHWYYDYEITQHTSDYTAWASWDSNNWDSGAYSSSPNTFGIVMIRD